ncbi:MAG: hypothetical protein ABIG39_06965 [Candidatus Micrarchaeota archaeon]
MHPSLFLPRGRSRPRYTGPDSVDSLLGPGRVAYFAKKKKKFDGGGGGTQGTRKTNAVSITTTVGTSIVSQTSKLFVSLGGGRYTEMFAKDLRPDTQVLFHKSGIRVNLEEVEPILSKSKRYQATFGYLFERDQSGDTITKPNGSPLPILRVKLIKGLAGLGVVEDPLLNDRVLFNQPDFTPQQYQDMVGHVSLTLSGTDQKLKRSDGAIKAWLTGDTIAPSDFSIFIPLAKINPEFERLADPDGEFAKNYELYVNVRRGIMAHLAFLNEREGDGSGRESDTRPRSLSLAPEIALVVNHFVEQISDQYVVARVCEVKDVQVTKEQKARESSGAGLSKGVVTKKPEREEVAMDLRPISETYERMKILDETLFSAIWAFLGDTPVTISGKVMKLTSPSRATVALSLLRLKNTNNPFDNEFFKGMDSRTRKELIEKGAADVKVLETAIESGEIDKMFELKKGTIAKAFEMYYASFSVLPKLYYDERNAAGRYTTALVKQRMGGKSIDRGTLKALERADKKTYEKLLSQYGIDVQGSKKLLTASQREGIGQAFDGVYIQVILDPGAAMQLKHRIENAQPPFGPKTQFYTAEDVMVELRKMGLEELSACIPPTNFV